MLIRSGTVVDGTGAPAVQADVRVRDGRIAEVGHDLPPLPNEDVHDAAGMILAPGFLDIHTHSDVSLHLDGRGESKLFQGVTTEVIGNCGFSPFPLTPGQRTAQLDLLEGIGDARIDPEWTDFTGYAAALEADGIAVNVIPLVGHGALRLAVAGTANRELTAEELEAAQTLLADLLEQGAHGLSTGLTYVPSRFAPKSELIALCQVIEQHRALYATHARGDGLPSVTESVQLAEETGARVQYSHLAINNPDKWGTADKLLTALAEARERGVDVAADVYPYAASASALTQYIPVWVQDGGMAAMRERLADPETLARARDDLAAGWGAAGIPWFWDRVQVSRADGIAGVRDGETLETAARRLDRDPAGLVLELCREGGHQVQVVMHYRTEEDMQAFLAAPFTTMGSDGSAVPYDLGDRKPHPRFFGASVRVLGRYVRELGLLDLPTAVHKMTGAVAERFRLSDRGVIREGAAADLVLFDAATVTDTATFTDPAQQPEGVAAVWVNGELAVSQGQQTNTRAGRVLRKARVNHA